MPRETKDRYRYFRVEARELLTGITDGVLALERDADSEEQVKQVLRLTHTLKGASGVVGLSAVRDRAHAIEEILVPYRDEATTVPSAATDELLQLVDAIEKEIVGLPSEPTTAPEPLSATFDTGRVDAESLNSVAAGISEASVRLEEIRRVSTDLEIIQRSLARHAKAGTESRPQTIAMMAEQLTEIQGRLSEGTDGAERELNNLDDQLTRLRLIPVQTLATTLIRATRYAARSVGKEVIFSMHGGECRVDAQVLEGLQSALLHLIRNAVDHGIEPPSERRASGKTEQGNVTVNVRQHGYRILIDCEDDGRGIDIEAVRQVAVKTGLVSTADAPSLGVEDLLPLLFEGGTTTAKSVTEISGRGVGLDVVHETITRLLGDVHIQSQPNRGTTVEMSVPISVSYSSFLRVEAGDLGAHIPLAAVHRTVRMSQADVSRVGETECITFGGQTIPFVPLLSVFGRLSNHNEADKMWSAVVIQVGSDLFAVGADQVAGIRLTIVRPLPATAGDLEVISGAIFDPQGNPEPVLDPKGLLMAARGRKVDTENITAARPPVLIVDDSLTTRMLQRSVLEGAGYEVDLASSAEEALQMVTKRTYGVILVDVEMPGMNGFDFIKHIKANPDLSDIPAILVTTLGSAEDRRRGLEAGAYAHIVKSEYDGKALCELVGHALG